MKIKRFNELFDTEDLRNAHEVNYLKGDINKIIGDMEPIDFNSDNIVRLIDRISREIPFFVAFKDEVSGYGFSTDMGFLEEIDSYIFNVMSEKDYSIVVSLLIKINSINNYDAYVIDEEKDDYGYNGLNYRQLVDFINDDYRKILIELGFNDLLEYNNEDGTINN